MTNKIILLVLVFTTNMVFARLHSDCEHSNKAKIVTSTTPIASVVSMITGDEANVIAIDDGSSGCPHHYHMRPSDKEKATNAKMLVYIDDNFDAFAGHLFEDFKGEVLKVSKIESINFIGTDGKKNWHFWLDLQNILKLQSAVADALIKELPESEAQINNNKIQAHKKIQSLIDLKSKELKGIGELVLMSDSLEHFFTGVDAKIVKLYQKSNASLKDFEKLENVLNTKTPLCIVIDSTQDPKLYKKYNKKIVQLESENWSLAGGYEHHHDDEHDHHEHEHDHRDDTSDLFYDKYVEMIEQLQGCR